MSRTTKSAKPRSRKKSAHAGSPALAPALAVPEGGPSSLVRLLIDGQEVEIRLTVPGGDAAALFKAVNSVSAALNLAERIGSRLMHPMPEIPLTSRSAYGLTSPEPHRAVGRGPASLEPPPPARWYPEVPVTVAFGDPLFSNDSNSLRAAGHLEAIPSVRVLLPKNPGLQDGPSKLDIRQAIALQNHEDESRKSSVDPDLPLYFPVE